MLKTLFPNGLKKAFTLSYDDGCYDDIKLIDLMSSLSLKGTFNIGSGLFRPEGTEPQGPWPRLTVSEAETYKRDGIEVAVHGITHRDFTKITGPELIYEIMSDKKIIEEMFGGVIRGAAYPYGSFDDRSVAALKSCGIKYCRTVWSDYSMNMPTDWLRLRPTAHHGDPKLPELVETFLNETPRDLKMLYIWGHTPEFRRDNNFGMMEDMLKKIAGRDDIWYATNIEICEYDLAAKALEYSADGKAVYNPTAKDVWLEKPNGEAMCLKSGETANV